MGRRLNDKQVTEIEEATMAKLGLFFSLGIFLLMAVSCGGEDNKKETDTGTNDGDTDSDTDGDTDGDTDTDTDTTLDTEDVDGLTACADFQAASWDRIRDCDNPLAALLPSNETAGTLCSSLCEVEDKTISRDDYNTCIEYATTIACEDINISLDPDAGSQIPEDCGFLQDTLNCAF
jgi:hypothetical protein